MATEQPDKTWAHYLCARLGISALDISHSPQDWDEEGKNPILSFPLSSERNMMRWDGNRAIMQYNTYLLKEKSYKLICILMSQNMT